MLVTLAHPAGAEECAADALGVTTANYSSMIWRAAALLQGAAPPDVFVQRSDAGTMLSQRLRGISGRSVWGPVDSRSPFAGVLVDDAARALVEVADGGACGALTVRRVDATTGRLIWTKRLPGVATFGRPHVDVRTPGLGDITGDGVADVPIVRSAQAGVGSFSHCVEQPSGVCRMLGANWSSRVDVLDGRTGRQVLAADLGSGSGAMPTARWLARGRSQALAVTVPIDAGTTAVRVYAGKGQAWQSDVATGAGDVVLRAGGSTLIAESSPTGYGELAPGSTVTAFDAATGRRRWTTTPAVATAALPLANGDVVLTDVPTGRLRRVHSSTGADVWAAVPQGPLREIPYAVGDVDGRGLSDIAVPLLDRTVVVASEDAKQILSVQGMPRLTPTSDVTGDGVADVLAVDDPNAATPLVTLFRGRDLRQVWSVSVPLGDSRTHAAEVEGRGGRYGSVLVHSRFGRRVVLVGSTGAVRWSVPGDGS